MHSYEKIYNYILKSVYLLVRVLETVVRVLETMVRGGGVAHVYLWV